MVKNMGKKILSFIWDLSQYIINILILLLICIGITYLPENAQIFLRETSFYIIMITLVFCSIVCAVYLKDKNKKWSISANATLFLMYMLYHYGHFEDFFSNASAIGFNIAEILRNIFFVNLATQIFSLNKIWKK